MQRRRVRVGGRGLWSACGDNWDGAFCFTGTAGGGNTGGGGGDTGGGGGATPPPSGGTPAPAGTECCSLFDCGETIQCDCGEVQGCNIPSGAECGFCYTAADCDAYCASR